MPHNSTRLGLPIPDLPDTADVPRDFDNLADDLDIIVLAFDQGPAASRPAQPYAKGHMWWSTDTGLLSYSDGTVWHNVNDPSTFPVDGPANVGSLRTLGIGQFQAVAGNDSRLSDQRVPVDGSVTANKVANSLKPSAGAGGASEALRALGTAPGQAAAGTHGTQHGPTGGDPLPWASINLIGTLNQRPAPSSQNNGLLYFATDVQGGTLYRSNGTAWTQIGLGITSGAAVITKTSRSTDFTGITGQAAPTDPATNPEFTIMTCPPVSRDGTQEVSIEVYVAAWNVLTRDQTTTNSMEMYLYDNGSPAGLLTRNNLMGTNTDTLVGVMRKVYTPAAGSHQWDVRVKITFNGLTAVVRAGDGTAKNYTPMFMRVVS